MFRHYKLPCMLWAVALVAGALTVVTGEYNFTFAILYGLYAIAETIRRTRILWRRYRRAIEKGIQYGKTA